MKLFEAKERVAASAAAVAMSMLRSLPATRVYIYGTIAISRYFFEIGTKKNEIQMISNQNQNGTLLFTPFTPLLIMRFVFLLFRLNKYIKYVIIMPTLWWCACACMFSSCEGIHRLGGRFSFSIT